MAAPLRHAAGLCECLFIGVDRKSSAHRQNDAIDPQQTSDIRSHSSGPDSYGSYRELRLELLGCPHRPG
jgi:hypothetical protein